MRPELAAEYVPGRMLNNILPPDTILSKSSGRRWSEIKANIRHAGVVGSGHGYSLVHACAEYGHESLLDLLLEKGADVNALCQGRTPLHLSLRQGLKPSTIKLLDHGADVYLVLKPNGKRSYQIQINGGRHMPGIGVDELVALYQIQEAWIPWMLDYLAVCAIILLLFLAVVLCYYIWGMWAKLGYGIWNILWFLVCLFH